MPPVVDPQRRNEKDTPDAPAASPAACRAAARLGRSVELALATVDLSPAQYRVLAQLSEGEEGSSALAAKLAVRPPTLTNVVEGLVRRDLVERRPGSLDRRTVSYTVTETGRAQLAAADGAVRERLEQIATSFEDETSATRAFEGLELWKAALDENRRRNLAASARPAGTAARPAGSADSTGSAGGGT